MDKEAFRIGFRGQGLQPAQVETQRRRLLREHVSDLPMLVEDPGVGLGPDLGPDPGGRALICLAGERWSSAVLAAAWLQPVRVLVLRCSDPGAPEQAARGEGLLDALLQVTKLSLDGLEQQRLGPAEELPIYQEVREFLARSQSVPGRETRCMIDVSAAPPLAAAAGAMAAEAFGLELLHFEAERWEAGRGPRLLRSPSRLYGEVPLRELRAALAGGRYRDAELRALELASRLESPRPMQALAALAAGYGAWHRFDFAPALGSMRQAEALMEAHEVPQGFEAGGEGRRALRAGLGALQELCALDPLQGSLQRGLPLVLNHFAAARRALAQDDCDDALLLLHGTVERLVDLSLHLEHGVDTELGMSDAALGSLDLSSFHALGETLFPEYRPLAPAGPLLYRRAVQLLGTLDVRRVGPESLGWMKGLGMERNALSHALVPRHPSAQQLRPRFKQVANWLEGQAEIGGRLEALLERFVFPEFRALL